MDATTMHSMSSLIHKLSTDHPGFIFFETEQFSWSPATRTVNYALKAPNAPELLLHELSHGLLEHNEYQRDIQLLAIEAAAWEKARTLAAQYDVKLAENLVQDHLDTYREWMHARSTCPECTSTGYQTGASEYSCPACTHKWRVNEARICGLKRYTIS